MATNCDQNTSKSCEVSTGMKMTMKMMRARFPSVRQIQTEELENMMASNGEERTQVVLLDVREKKEYKVSHLKGAHYVNPETKDMAEVLALINQQVSNQEDPKSVVAYCSVGYRASCLIQSMMNELAKPEYSKDRNLTNLYNLEGSIFKWANEGRPMVDSDNHPVQVVHPFSHLWGKFLNKERVGPL